MRLKTISAIMIHVPNWEEGVLWYEKAFPDSKRIDYPEFEFECLEMNGIQIEIVNADNKVGTGPFGVAVDWEVVDLNEAITHFTAIGATLYRGPMAIEHGRRMCKLQDPWGNLIGLRGK